MAGQDENARADNAADAQRDQVPWPQRPFEVAFVGGIFRNVRRHVFHVSLRVPQATVTDASPPA